MWIYIVGIITGQRNWINVHIRSSIYRSVFKFNKFRNFWIRFNLISFQGVLGCLWWGTTTWRQIEARYQFTSFNISMHCSIDIWTIYIYHNTTCWLLMIYGVILTLLTSWSVLCVLVYIVAIAVVPAWHLTNGFLNGDRTNLCLDGHYPRALPFQKFSLAAK